MKSPPIKFEIEKAFIELFPSFSCHHINNVEMYFKFHFNENERLIFKCVFLPIIKTGEEDLKLYIDYWIWNEKIARTTTHGPEALLGEGLPESFLEFVIFNLDLFRDKTKNDKGRRPEFFLDILKEHQRQNSKG